MANYLSKDAVERIRVLSLESYTTRQIARITGINRNTVQRYRGLLKLNDEKCACGLTLQHRGFCRVRYARSLERQHFMERWHPKSLREIAETLDTTDRCYLGE